MRTTLNIQDQAMASAQAFAAARALKLGDAVSELILQGARQLAAEQAAQVSAQRAEAGQGNSLRHAGAGLWTFDTAPAASASARAVKALLQAGEDADDRLDGGR